MARVSAPDEDERTTLLASVDVTVGALAGTIEADAALVHLAQLYAEQIDRARGHAAYASALARDVMKEQGDEGALYERVAALQAKVSERDTIDRLGARLHAALAELQATPKARNKDGVPAPAASGPSALRGLRAASGGAA